MENIIIAAISGLVAILVAFISVSRRLRASADSTPADPETGEEGYSIFKNHALIETLNNTVEAQTQQIEILRKIVDEQRVQLQAKDREISDLTIRVSNLEKLTIEQALIIRQLEKVRGFKYRDHNEGGETQGHD
jgi:hypothetical protein